jgi:kinetochore protein Spc7/SPC105
VIFTEQKAKAVVSFIFDADTFSSWPMSIRSVRCEVEIVYGLIK